MLSRCVVLLCATEQGYNFTHHHTTSAYTIYVEQQKASFEEHTSHQTLQLVLLCMEVDAAFVCNLVEIAGRTVVPVAGRADYFVLPVVKLCCSLIP